ncbi:single-stranded DNA-binding protein [Spirosoma areae]
MQRITITGNVGQDAVIKQHNGESFITFSVACNEKFKNREGIEVEKTQWYNCIYQPKSQAIARYLTRGTKVYVEGKPNVRTYQNAAKETAVDFGIQVRGIELLGGNSPEKSPAVESKPMEQTESKPALAMSGDSDENDLPF